MCIISTWFNACSFLCGEQVIQKDLGTSLILASICFICFMSTPRDYYKKYKKLVWIALGVAVVILGFLITAVLQGYQMERINSWLKPLELENIYSSSWQLVNSLIAFADGGIFGLGLGNSIQKYDYIPEAHNDFIGAIIYEELWDFWFGFNYYSCQQLLFLDY